MRISVGTRSFTVASSRIGALLVRKAGEEPAAPPRPSDAANAGVAGLASATAVKPNATPPPAPTDSRPLGVSAMCASTYFGGYDKSQVSPISCPDNVAFDRHGNLWISTDGNALGSNDGLFGVAVEGRDRGLTRQFLTVPFGAETCGPVVQRKRVLVCVQHPGEKDGATADAPASHWPDGGTSLPRPAIALVRRKDGGDIGA